VSRRAFAPAPLPTAVALLVALLCAGLGVWQWRRGVGSEAERARFARGADVVIDLGARAVTEVPLYQRVRLGGLLDGTHQFLLDNRTWHGRAGYEVLTPLARAEPRARPAQPLLLVDRGWVPFAGTRARLPDVRLCAAAPAELSGRLARLPSPGLAFGRAGPAAAAPWPKVTSYPQMSELAAALGVPLAARILLLDPLEPCGYVRDWQPPGLPPLRHFAYAIQWWIFAGLALVLWALLSRRAASADTPP
jgi:surfeit locus 1 family protein